MPGASQPRFLIFEDWEHIFVPGRSPQETRFVYDRETRLVIHAALRGATHGVVRDGLMRAVRPWVPASITEVEDLFDEVESNGYHNIASSDLGIQESDTLPAWAVPAKAASRPAP